MTPLRLLAIIEAYSITGPARNLLEFARRAAEQNVGTTIATFTRNTHWIDAGVYYDAHAS
jgi:hypothetical protein